MPMKMAEGSNINVNYCEIEFSQCKRAKGSSLVNQKSSYFLFQRSQCYVNVSYGWEINDERKIIKLYIESQPTLSPGFYTTVSVSAGEDTVHYPREKILDLKRILWSSSLSELYRKLSDLDKKNMKFRIVFEKDLESNPGQKRSGHKLVQTSCLNDSNSLERFSDDFSKLLNHDTMYDVQLKSGDYVIRAHKSILGARSKYFENRLQSTKDQLVIQNIDPAALHEILRYIYTGKCPDLSFELAKNIYMSGEISDSGCLREQCIQFLIDNLTMENACECLAFAAEDYFKEKVVTYIISMGIPYLEEYWAPFCDLHQKPAIDLLNKLVRIMRRQRSIDGIEN